MEEITPARRHPAVMLGAWIAVAACALVAIAYLLGWMPHRDTTAPVAAKPAPAKSATTQSGVVLLPGETLVAAPDPVPAPAPSPAIAPPAQPAKPAPAPTTPRYTRTTPPRALEPRPEPPVVAQDAPRALPPRQVPRDRPSSFERSTRSVCLNCGVVTDIRRGDYDWEVRVRFDDGRGEILRYYDRPRVEAGDAVHLVEGRLVRD